MYKDKGKVRTNNLPHVVTTVARIEQEDRAQPYKEQTRSDKVVGPEKDIVLSKDISKTYPVVKSERERPGRNTGGKKTSVPQPEPLIQTVSSQVNFREEGPVKVDMSLVFQWTQMPVQIGM